MKKQTDYCGLTLWSGRQIPCRETVNEDQEKVDGALSDLSERLDPGREGGFYVGHVQSRGYSTNNLYRHYYIAFR